PIVADIVDARKAAIVERAYPGRVEVVPSDRIVSRLMVQIVRHPGLSHVATELLTHSRGNAVHLREHPSLEGMAAGDLQARFDRAIVLGVVRREGQGGQPMLNPPPATPLIAGDRLVLLAREYADTEPGEPSPASAAGFDGNLRTHPTPAPGQPRRLLLLGWSHRVPAIITELEELGLERFEVDVMSSMPAAERERRLAEHGTSPARVVVRHLDGDYTTSGRLLAVDPA